MDSIHNILIFFAEKIFSHFFSKKFQNICITFNVNFNDSLTNDVVSFEQLGPDDMSKKCQIKKRCKLAFKMSSATNLNGALRVVINSLPPQRCFYHS